MSGGPDTSYGGAADAFVAKVSADGTGLVYCGYIGGASEDAGTGIALDGSGRAYVTGYTDSDATTFPVTVGPGLVYQGAGDAFVARIDASGTTLDYCGYVGGTGVDGGSGIAVDSSGNAFIAGYTTSSEATFPVLVGPTLTLGGSFDAFVAKVDVSGTALQYCGYIGGSGDDHAHGIAVDAEGRAVVVGDTASDETTFPVLVGPDLTYNGGYSDAFVARVNAAGSALDASGYVGGADTDSAAGVAIDPAGNIYIAGITGSSQATFPVTVGPGLVFGGVYDAFVAKLAPDASQLLYCGYIGGIDIDSATAIAVDGMGRAYVAGWTYSTEGSFPVVNGPDSTYNGGSDAFVAMVKANGAALLYCGYVGGESTDFAGGIAVSAPSGPPEQRRAPRRTSRVTRSRPSRPSPWSSDRA